jgi:putative redox protein
MEIEVFFPGGLRTGARLRDFTIMTDQPLDQCGENTAPSPMELFQASLATCAGYYVMRFCQQRKIPTDGIRLVQRAVRNPESKMITKIGIEIQLPDGFPERYRAAVVKAADQCAVKKHLQHPPEMEVTTVITEPQVEASAVTQ